MYGQINGRNYMSLALDNLCLFNFVYLGEWWKNDARDVYEEFLRTGGAPNDSDAITINGQPGDLYACKIR